MIFQREMINLLLFKRAGLKIKLSTSQYTTEKYSELAREKSGCLPFRDIYFLVEYYFKE